MGGNSVVECRAVREFCVVVEVEKASEEAPRRTRKATESFMAIVLEGNV
jgi:hypothetical protein